MITEEKLVEEITVVENRLATVPSFEDLEFVVKHVKEHMKDIILCELLKCALCVATMIDEETKGLSFNDKIKKFAEYHLNKLPSLIEYLKYDDDGKELTRLKATSKAVEILIADEYAVRPLRLKDSL